MSRRAALPGADELFRTTADQPATPAAPLTAVPAGSTDGQPSAERASSTGVRTTAVRRARSQDRRPSGRERHDEKITVYVSAEELMDLERARVDLFENYGLRLDRGRIVREALAMVLGDLEAKGESSILVRRLRSG